MISTLALIGVVAIAVFLIGFALLVVFKPDSAVSFMRLFATSAKAHFTELFFRLGAGACLILAAPQLAFGRVFDLFGWTLVGTSLVLAVMPWRWHRSFARKVIPVVLDHLRLYGISSLLLGIFVVVGILTGGSH